jgi:hypothetical protein
MNDVSKYYTSAANALTHRVSSSSKNGQARRFNEKNGGSLAAGFVE